MSEVTLSEELINQIVDVLFAENAKGTTDSELDRCLSGCVDGSKLLELLRSNSANHNAVTSRLELIYWQNSPPDRYTAYVRAESQTKGVITTWTGELLGTCSFGKRWRSNIGDERISIRVRGNNGRDYHGIYYASNSDICRIKAIKKERQEVRSVLP